ncbi:MAG: hypothetical protein GWP61_04310 [Chloroflexi bacterium]|nr:hypothetical protein [Chloroflexota bacterium]
MKRPFAVTLLALIAVLAGIVAILDTLRLLGLLPVVQLGPMEFFGQSIIGAIFAGIVALIWFWAAAKIWNLDPQGWLFIVVIAVVYLIFDVVALIGGTPIQSMALSLVLTILALILAILPGTKQAFGQ